MHHRSWLYGTANCLPVQRCRLYDLRLPFRKHRLRPSLTQVRERLVVVLLHAASAMQPKRLRLRRVVRVFVRHLQRGMGLTLATVEHGLQADRFCVLVAIGMELVVDHALEVAIALSGPLYDELPA